MIELLKDIFIALVYTTGILFFAFFALFLFIALVRIWQERK